MRPCWHSKWRFARTRGIITLGTCARATSDATSGGDRTCLRNMHAYLLHAFLIQVRTRNMLFKEKQNPNGGVSL